MIFAGYSLIDLEDNTEIRTWATTSLIPQLNLPNGNIVCAPTINVEYSGYKLVERYEINEKPSKWHASIGQTSEFVDNKFVVTILYPVEPNLAPDTVSNFQGRSILVLNGLDETVNNAINAIENETERKLAQLAWEKGSFDRNSPLLNNIMLLLGKDDNFRDQLFRDAYDLFV